MNVDTIRHVVVSHMWIRYGVMNESSLTHVDTACRSLTHSLTHVDTIRNDMNESSLTHVDTACPPKMQGSRPQYEGVMSHAHE